MLMSETTLLAGVPWRHLSHRQQGTLPSTSSALAKPSSPLFRHAQRAVTVRYTGSMSVCEHHNREQHPSHNIVACRPRNGAMVHTHPGGGGGLQLLG